MTESEFSGTGDVSLPLNKYEVLSPLQLDMILTEILTLLPVQDLITSRLVSTQWNQRALEILKKKQTQVIQFNSKISKRTNGHNHKTRPSSCYNQIQEFTNVMKSSQDIPYSSYKLTNISLGNPIVTDFFQTCNYCVKALMLDLDLSQSKGCKHRKPLKAAVFKSLLRTLETSLEVLDIDYLPSSVTNPRNKDFFNDAEPEVRLNLKKISFPACEGHYCPEFWGRVFKTSKNLEEISVNESEQSTPLLKALTDSARLSQLSSLRLEYIGAEHMESLLQSDLTLSDFKFNIISKEIPAKKLEALLKKLSPRLKVLAMGSPSDDWKMQIKLPKMSNILRLGMFHCDDSLITLESIRFAEDTPKLQALEISSGIRNFDWQGYLSVPGNLDSSLKTVTELQIGLLVADHQCVYFLGRTFPNVKKLSLEFPRRDFLRAVWTTWENLEELNLYFHVNNEDSKDHFIFGIPSEWKDKVKRKYDLSCPEWWNLVGDNDALPIVDSICNLKALQRLNIEQSPNSGMVSDLTDFSVFFGFAKLQNLRVLKIGRSQISPLAERYLWRKLPMISSMDIRDARGPGVFSSEERDELVDYIKYYEDKAEYGEQE